MVESIQDSNEQVIEWKLYFEYNFLQCRSGRSNLFDFDFFSV